MPQLEHAADNPFLGQRQPPPLPVEVDGELEYHVDQILDPRLFGCWRKHQSRSSGRATIARRAAGKDGLQAVDRFHALHP